MANVDYKSPIYLQLREVVRSKIEEGEYPPGMAIPSENELSEMYGVNRLTVRNAVDALVHEGLLRRIQGKGAFVVGDLLERDLDSLSGFRQTIHERNAEPGTKILTKVRVRVLKTGKEKTYQLVTEGEANSLEGKIAVTTPIAKGLMGKKVGDIAQVQVPAGLMEYEILEISL